MSKKVGIGKVIVLKMLVCVHIPELCKNLLTTRKSPQLEDNETWEPSILMTGIEDVDTNRMSSARLLYLLTSIRSYHNSPRVGGCVPRRLVNMHVSSNNIRHIKARCSCAPSPADTTRYALSPPQATSMSMLTPPPGIEDFQVAHMTESLLSALLSDIPPTDILHSLVNPALPLSLITEALERTLRTLDCEEFGTRDWHGVISGIALEIFK